MRTTGLSLAVLALIGDTQAVEEARYFFQPLSFVQRDKESKKEKAMTADDYNSYDKYDSFESQATIDPVVTKDES